MRESQPRERGLARRRPPQQVQRPWGGNGLGECGGQEEGPVSGGAESGVGRGCRAGLGRTFRRFGFYFILSFYVLHYGLI